MRNLCTAVLLILGVACNNSTKTTTADAGSGSGAPVDAFYSVCGEPGDTGDANGIGHFCETLSDCPSTAPLCSHVGDATTFFCTLTCSPPGSGGSGSDVCGSANTCTCQGSNNQPPCGCTPNSCLGD